MFINLGKVDLESKDGRNLKENVGIYLHFIELDRENGDGVLRARITDGIRSRPLDIKKERMSNIICKLPISQKEMVEFAEDNDLLPLTKSSTKEAIEALVESKSLPWEFILEGGENDAPVLKIRENGCESCRVTIKEKAAELFFQ